jgi:hypothetical protein
MPKEKILNKGPNYSDSNYPCSKFLRTILNDPLKAAAEFRNDHSLGKYYNNNWKEKADEYERSESCQDSLLEAKNKNPSFGECSKGNWREELEIYKAIESQRKSCVIAEVLGGKSLASQNKSVVGGWSTEQCKAYREIIKCSNLAKMGGKDSLIDTKLDDIKLMGEEVDQ